MKAKKNKKRKVWPFVLGIIGTLCIMAALAVTLCRTRAYVIEGNNYYSDNTIRTWIENDKLSFNTLAILAKYNMTEAELPAGVEQLHISLKNPWTVKVTVEEKEMAGYVTLDVLKEANPNKVRQELCELNKKYKLELANPTAEQIAEWIANAAK